MPRYREPDAIAHLGFWIIFGKLGYELPLVTIRNARDTYAKLWGVEPKEIRLLRWRGSDKTLAVYNLRKGPAEIVDSK